LDEVLFGLLLVGEELLEQCCNQGFLHGLFGGGNLEVAFDPSDDEFGLFIGGVEE